MIVVVDYDPSWPARYAALAVSFDAAFGEAGVTLVAIEHVGSTSVPGLAAKPVIDLDLVVGRDDVGPATDVLVSLGFRPEGELGIPDRFAFTAPPAFGDTHAYVVVEGALSLRNHLAVRDTLRRRKDLRDEYGGLKRQLAARTGSIEEYGRGKSEVIGRILAEAGMDEGERRSIAANEVPSRATHPRGAGPAARPPS